MLLREKFPECFFQGCAFCSFDPDDTLIVLGLWVIVDIETLDISNDLDLEQFVQLLFCIRVELLQFIFNIMEDSIKELR